MPLGTLQLIYVGEQNIYITDNPEITFFKTVYKRHTNFTIDTIQEFFNTKINFGQQNKCKLSKNGDLLSRVGIYFRLSSLNRNCPDPPLIECTKNTDCLCTCSKCLLGSDYNDNLIYGYANSIGHVLIEWIEIWIGGN